MEEGYIETKSTDLVPKLATALAKAQKLLRASRKDGKNPHFKSEYSTLAEVIDVIRDPFADNGLAYLQLPTADADGVTVTTRLIHTSGEEISFPLWLPVAQKTPQAYGSSITYARRYALMGMAGIAPADDDGNAGSGEKPIPSEAEAVPAREPLWVTEIKTEPTITETADEMAGRWTAQLRDAETLKELQSTLTAINKELGKFPDWRKENWTARRDNQVL